jgi:hypothetical protein
MSVTVIVIESEIHYVPVQVSDTGSTWQEFIYY